MLYHRVRCIFLTTLLPYVAVTFYFGQYEKLLRYGKLATSYIEVPERYTIKNITPPIKITFHPI